MDLKNYFKRGKDVSWLDTYEASLGNGDLDWNFERRKKPIEYIYLPFQPNGINCCPSGGLDVLSSGFSGCIMATFTKDTGGWFVCHVSTGQGQDCRDNWNDIIIREELREVNEFRPSDYIKTDGQAFANCYGLITPELECYAITVTRVSKKGGGEKRIVVGIERCQRIQPEGDERATGPGGRGDRWRFAATDAATEAPIGYAD